MYWEEIIGTIFFLIGIWLLKSIRLLWPKTWFIFIMSSWASTIWINFIIFSVICYIHLLWSYLWICQNCPLGQFIWHLIYWKSLFLEIIVFTAAAFTWLLISYCWKKQIKISSILLIKVLVWFYSRESLFIFTTHNSFRSAVYFSKRFDVLSIIL